jgi:hypothetical protein
MKGEGSHEGFAVRQRMRWHRTRQAAIACLPLAVAAFVASSFLAPGPWQQALHWIGGIATAVFVVGFAVLPFYASVRTFFVAGTGPVGDATRLLRAIARAERAVVSTRKTATRAIFVLYGLSVIGGFVAFLVTQGVSAALDVALGLVLLGAGAVVELIQAVSFFVFIKRLNPRQCELAVDLLATLAERLGAGQVVRLECALKGYESNPQAPEPEPTMWQQTWDHEWLTCVSALPSGATLDIRLVQHAEVHCSGFGTTSLVVWATALTEEAVVTVRLDSSIFAGAMFRDDSMPVGLDGIDAAFKMIDSRTLRARAVTRSPVSVKTEDGETTTGDESGLLDAEQVWKLVEACCSGLAVTDYRREVPLRLLP